MGFVPSVLDVCRTVPFSKAWPPRYDAPKCGVSGIFKLAAKLQAGHRGQVACAALAERRRAAALVQAQQYWTQALVSEAAKRNKRKATEDFLLLLFMSTFIVLMWSRVVWHDRF